MKTRKQMLTPFASALMALAIAFSALTALALPPQQQSCPPTNERPPSTGGAQALPNTIIAPADSLAIVTPLQGGSLYFNNIVGKDTSPSKDFYKTVDVVPGTQFNAGSFKVGTELILRLKTPEAYTFYTGPASRNQDNLVHANVYRLPGTNTFVVGWEDLSGGGDKDYDDVVLQVCFLPDSDLDGVPDQDEDAGPLGGDANNDKIPDSQQRFVATTQQMMNVLIGQGGAPQNQQHSRQLVTVAADAIKVALLRSTTQIGLLASIMGSAGDTNAQLSVVRAESERPVPDQQASADKMLLMTQKQQQTLQMLSNITKTMHDSVRSLRNNLKASNDRFPLRESRPRAGRNAQVFASHSSMTRARVVLSPQAEPAGIVIAKTIPADFKANTYYAFGPTLDNSEPHAYEFLFDGTTGAEFIDGGVLLHYVDGQRGDNDLTVNGVIEAEGALLEVNLGPTARAHNVVKSAGADCQASVTAQEVDNGSTDPEDKPLTLTLSPAGPYPVGTTQVTLTATDEYGLSHSSIANVTVEDDAAPVLGDITVDKPSINYSNHKMVDVTVSYTATDNCGTPTPSLSVTSNEPINGTGDGDTSPDWEIIDNHRVRLRAERAGTGGAGRIYTIRVTVTDNHGNSSFKTVTVTVPKNSKK